MSPPTFNALRVFSTKELKSIFNVFLAHCMSPAKHPGSFPHKEASIRKGNDVENPTGIPDGTGAPGMEHFMLVEPLGCLQWPPPPPFF